GEAWVELPAWFEALNRDFRYQLTCIATTTCIGNSRLQRGQGRVRVSRSALLSSRLCLQFKQTTTSKVL
ncbi:MAG: hypothetical protein WHS83_13705, partial [Chloroflexus sp.]|uniref:hypothetical protein n=1 Tax=Chloroflexus sp. TaxID=1904827 RepID=UPI0030A9047E